MLSSKKVESALTVEPNVAQPSAAPEGNVSEVPGCDVVAETWSSTRPFDSVMTPKLESLGNFLQSYPESDGRDVVIAILDTGVDPKLDGMQITTTGERKLIRMYDCSGAGDVDCSHSVTAKDGTVTGLTGRTLNVGAIKNLNNPSGKFYIGVKHIHELYVKSLKTTMEKDRHIPNWESASNLALADARRLLDEHEKEVGGKSSDRKERLKREDLACKVEFLKDNIKKEDKGPVADVLMWNDGKTWKAMLDTSFRGKLGMCTTMGSYAENYEFCEGTVQGDQLTYSFNIYPDEKKVEVVTACGSHGSHVASIAAANYPQNPALNGLAPGAKVVSLCIGDARLGSTETGAALTRAFSICRDLNVDIINMSYGEGVDFPDTGRVIDELKTLLEGGKALFFSSAGNQGPALSSVGCPGGTTSGVIGVGALLLPNQLSQLYGTANNVDEPEPFLWSSCGPSVDGSDGVSIYAPGAAVAEVPKYTRKCNQLMNGTSMSSPNAAGAVACLVSRLKQDGKKFSPYEVRLALQQSSAHVKGCLAGMLSVPNAYQFLKLHEARRLNLYDVKVTCRRWGVPGVTRGIYMRNASDFATSPHKYSITIEPLFPKGATPAEKTNFLERVSLEVEGVEESFPARINALRWQIPEVLNLTSGESSFSVLLEYDSRANPKNAEAARGWIVGRDQTERVIFQVPFAILPPQSETDFQMTLSAGKVERRLINVPEDRNIACIVFTCPPLATNERVVLHAVQNIPDHAMRSHELAKGFGAEKESRTFAMKVVPGRALELCTTLSTLSYKQLNATVAVTFYNLLHDPVIHLSTSSVANRFFVETVSDLPIEFEPAIALRAMATYHKPTEMKLEPLASRDVFGDGIQINRILLTYKVNVAKAGDCQFELAGLSEYLYEGAYDDLFIQIFSNSKEYVGASSSFRERYVTKLEKGEYKVIVQVRHPQESALEKLKDSTLTVYHKLASPISLDCYRTAASLVKADNGKWAKQMLAPTQRATIFVQNIPEEKLGKPAAGSTLRGVFTPFGGEWKDRYTVPVVLHVATPESKRQSKALSMVELEAPKKEKEPVNIEFQNAIRDVKIKFIEKMENLQQVMDLYNEVNDSESVHLPLEMAYLRKLAQQASAKMEFSDQARTEFLSQADRVLMHCNPLEVLAYMGTQNTDGSVEIAASKEEFDQKKEALIETLIAKVNLFAKMKIAKFQKGRAPQTLWEELQAPASSESATEPPVSESAAPTAIAQTETEINPATALEESFLQLQKYIALDDAKMHVVYAKYAIANDLHAVALKAAEKHISDARTAGKTPEIDERILSELAHLCGWDHLETAFRNDYLHRNRPSYRPF